MRDGMSDVLFFDTYALFEVVRGNENYKEYTQKTPVITIFNAAELNYGLKRDSRKEDADELTKKFIPFIIDVSFEDIKKAMSLKNEKRFLSIPDAIGYTVAERLNIPFLTGDEDFKQMKNVLFVKK